MDLAKIKIHSDGVCSSITVNGMDVSACCVGVEFIHEAGKFPIVSIRLATDDVEIDGEAEVVGDQQPLAQRSMKAEA